MMTGGGGGGGHIEVKVTGPLFRGADQQVDPMIEEITEAIARDGQQAIKQNLDKVLKHPTGHYRGSVRIDRAQRDRSVNDSKVIYGAWLEGESSRNRTTRFKGYHTFRRTTQQVDKRAIATAQPIVNRYVARWNS